MKLKIFLLLALLILISPILAEPYLDCSVYGNCRESPSVITFNNNTGAVNISQFADIWITAQGNMDNIPDIDYSDFGGSGFWDINVDLGNKNITNVNFINGVNISNLSNVNANLYVPYSGATKDIALGSKAITTTGIGTFGQVYTSNIVSGGTLTVTGNIIPSGTSSLGSATYPFYNGYFASAIYSGSGGAITTISGTGLSSSSGVLSFGNNNLTTINKLTANNISAGNITTGYINSLDDKWCNSTNCYALSNFLTGGGGGNPFDQSLNKTDNVTFNNITMSGDLTINANKNISLGASRIYNDGTHLRIIPDQVAGTGDIYIGNKQAGVDYRIFVDGESNSGIIDFDEDNDRFALNDKWYWYTQIGVGNTPNANTAIKGKLSTTATTTNQLGVSGQLSYGWNSNSNTAYGYYGGYFEYVTASTWTGNLTGSAYGVKGVNNHYGSGTLDEVYGLAFQIVNRDIGNITNAVTVYVQPTLNLGAGYIDSTTGVLIDQSTAGVTSNTGIYLNGDGLGSDIALGDNKETKIYELGNDLNFNLTSSGGVYIWNGSGYGTIHAGDFVQYTSVYNSSKGSALDYLKDSTKYLTSTGSINHSAFYGNIISEQADTSRPIKEKRTREICNLVNETGELNCSDVVYEVTTYPYTKQVEGDNIGDELAWLRQVNYEQQVIIDNQQTKINNLDARIRALELGVVKP